MRIVQVRKKSSLRCSNLKKHLLTYVSSDFFFLIIFCTHIKYRIILYYSIFSKAAIFWIRKVTPNCLLFSTPVLLMFHYAVNVVLALPPGHGCMHADLSPGKSNSVAQEGIFYGWSLFTLPVCWCTHEYTHVHLHTYLQVYSYRCIVKCSCTQCYKSIYAPNFYYVIRNTLCKWHHTYFECHPPK